VEIVGVCPDVKGFSLWKKPFDSMGFCDCLS